jgi:hypothetical protein
VQGRCGPQHAEVKGRVDQRVWDNRRTRGCADGNESEMSGHRSRTNQSIDQSINLCTQRHSYDGRARADTTSFQFTRALHCLKEEGKEKRRVLNSRHKDGLSTSQLFFPLILKQIPSSIQA